MQKRQGRTITNDNLSLEIFKKKKQQTYMAIKNFIFLNKICFVLIFIVLVLWVLSMATVGIQSRKLVVVGDVDF